MKTPAQQLADAAVARNNAKKVVPAMQPTPTATPTIAPKPAPMPQAPKPVAQPQVQPTTQPVAQPVVQPTMQSDPNKVPDFLNYSKAPQPTVATPQQPAILHKTPGGEQPATYDASDVNARDKNKLEDYIDQMQVKSMYGEQLSQDDMFKLIKAQKRMQQVTQEGMQSFDPYKEQLDLLNKQKAETQTNLQSRGESLISAEEQRLKDYYEAQKAELQEYGNKDMAVAQKAMSFSGLGRSTYNATQQQEIQTRVSRQQAMMDSEMNLVMEQYRAKINGATEETLQAYDQQIAALAGERGQYLAETAMKMNEFNMQASASFSDRVNDIMQLAIQNQPARELTEGDIAMAQSMGRLLIDANGGVNSEIMKAIPPELLPYAMMEGSLERGAVMDQKTALEYEKLQKSMGFSNVGQGIMAITDPNTGEVTFQKAPGYVAEKTGGTTQGSVNEGLNYSTNAIGAYSQEVRGREKLQCGELANDYVRMVTGTKGGMGNTFASKVEAVRAIGNSPKPVEGGLFVQDLTTSMGRTGHVGIVEKVNPDGSIVVFEANRPEGSKDGSTPKRRTIPASQTSNLVFSQAPGGGATPSTGQAEIDEIISFNDITSRRKMDENDVKRIAEQKKAIMSNPKSSIEDIMARSNGGRGIGADQSKTLVKFDQAMGQLDALQNQIGETKTGPILGRLRSLNPRDTDAQTLKAQITGLIPTIARGVYGEVGVLTDNDIRLYAQTLPNLKGTSSTNKGVLALTLDVLAGGYKKQLTSLAGQGYDVSGLEGTYLNIKSQADALKSELGIIPQQQVTQGGFTPKNATADEMAAYNKIFGGQ